MESLELLQNGYEVSHDVRKYCHTKEQDESANKSLSVASGMKIAEAHGRQRCKGVINADDYDEIQGLGV